jgi:hypothetical protein
MRSSSSKKIVGKFDVGLVDLVDQQHRAHRRGERIPELAMPDIVADVGNAGVAELGIPESRDRVVLVEALLRPRRRFDVPGEQRRPERGGYLLREQGLARPRFALDEQGTLQGDGGVDGGLEFVARDIGRGALETHACLALDSPPLGSVGPCNHASLAPTAHPMKSPTPSPSLLP